jgi:hypothetical protein
VAAGAPQITGTPTVGQAVACSHGAWSGDQLTFSFRWLRDGTPITGATGATYTIASADSDHQLACQVTASNVKGTASQTSASASVRSGGGGTAAPSLTAAKQTNRVWVAGNKLASISRTPRHSVGTVFTFTLDQTAAVRFAFVRGAPGRKVGKRCLAPTRRNRTRRACTRPIPAGSLTFNGHPGPNKVGFQGRLSPSRKLTLGKYTLVITATNAAGQPSAPRTLRFTIVRR